MPPPFRKPHVQTTGRAHRLISIGWLLWNLGLLLVKDTSNPLACYSVRNCRVRGEAPNHLIQRESIPSRLGVEQGWPGQLLTHHANQTHSGTADCQINDSLLKKNSPEGWGHSSVVKHLPSVCEAPGSSSGITPYAKGQKEKDGEEERKRDDAWSRRNKGSPIKGRSEMIWFSSWYQ